MKSFILFTNSTFTESQIFALLLCYKPLVFEDFTELEILY